MNNLSRLQAELTQAIQHRTTLLKSAEARELAARWISGNDRLSPQEQLEIYREQFWLRHTSALLEDFPGLSGVIGQAQWERMAESYLARFPPDSFSLRDLGAHLPEHVAGSCSWLDHHGLCVDMARIEWAYVEVFDAPDAEKLDPSRLAGLTPEDWQRARLELAPALRILAVDYPVADLRRQLKTSSTQDSVPLPDREPQTLLVYRAEGALFDQRVSPPAAALLEALRETALVGAIEQTLSAHPSQAAEVQAGLQKWFQDWTARGWITDVCLDA